MRYRFELIDDELVIRNLDVDVISAYVPECLPGSDGMDEWSAFRQDGTRVTTIFKGPGGCSPQEAILRSVAHNEQSNGYQSFENGTHPAAWTRTEDELGKLLVDIAVTFGRAANERSAGASNRETKSKLADLLTQLYAIWYVSRFGSCDADRLVAEPYFRNPNSWGKRFSFPEAVQHYGSFALTLRFPDLSEARRKQVLSLVIDLLGKLLDALTPATGPLHAAA
jgi:hypothetical protein